MSGSLGSRAAGVAVGLLLDRALGEPPTRWHPVAWFGTAMGHVEQRVWADRYAPGALYAATGLGLGVGVGAGVGALLPAGAPGVALACAVSCAGRGLRRAGTDVGARLLCDDLDGARALLPALVGRDPSTLDEAGVAAAVVESLAENLSDAVVGAAFWALVAGAPGALGFRAVNTMDAMVGHRGARYGRFGTAAARLDDLACWVPARLTAALVAVVRPGSAAAVVRTVRRDAGAHPSPNAGVPETAVAAALGRELGGPLRYGERVEDRPRLGAGPRPGPADAARARRLVDHAELALLATTAALALAAHVRRRTR